MEEETGTISSKKGRLMKTFTLAFLIDESLPPGGWENPYQLAIALKYALENRYAFKQVVDVQPAEKVKPVRAFCVVRK